MLSKGGAAEIEHHAVHVGLERGEEIVYDRVSRQAPQIHQVLREVRLHDVYGCLT